MGGPTAVYRTVVYVETFVEQHYNEQGRLFQRLSQNPESLNYDAVDWMSREAAALGSSESASPLRNMTRVLTACCSDEVNHMHEAAAEVSSSPSAIGSAARDLQVYLANLFSYRNP